MKRYILNILLFFSIVVAIDFCIGLIGDYLQANAKGGDTRKLNDLVMNDRHDIIILGSSRARHHYDTPYLSDTLGLDVYNAGYDGNGVVLAYGLLDMILARYQPKLVIFDVEPSFDISVYSGDNNHKRYISLLKPYYSKSRVREVIKDVSYEEWYKVHFGMLRYNSSLISLIADYLRSDNRSVPDYGYEPLVGCYDGEPRISTGINDPEDSFKLKYIGELIDLAQSHDVPIVFVASPQYGKNLSSVLQPAAEICKEKNVAFLNYYEDSTFMKHKDWFKEPMHLNFEGARLFSSVIVEMINAIIDNGE